MPASDAFPAVFDRLKEIVTPYAPRMGRVKDAPGDYYLEAKHSEKYDKSLMFAAAQVRKNYVSFHLMPVYMRTELLETLSPELKKRMQGKACFNFKAVDDALFAELAGLTERGFECFKKGGFV